MFPFVCPPRREKVEKDVTRESDKEGGLVLSSERSECERKSGNVERGKGRKRERERDKGKRENALRVPGKPMILKEGREDAH